VNDRDFNSETAWLHKNAPLTVTFGISKKKTMVASKIFKPSEFKNNMNELTVALVRQTHT
jgi:hypothetical protein